MSEQNESGPTSRQNPLIWIFLVVALLVVFVFVRGERGDTGLSGIDEAEDSNSGSIERSLLVPPGMRAREYVSQLRAAGQPYPLPEVYEKAQNYLAEGSLADAHLLYFFAARQDHLPSIMMMGEMADPTLFRAENSLLDHADVIQAYKWYQQAASLGDEAALARIESLQLWASEAAQAENPHARQLLLNFQ